MRSRVWGFGGGWGTPYLLGTWRDRGALEYHLPGDPKTVFETGLSPVLPATGADGRPVSPALGDRVLDFPRGGVWWAAAQVLPPGSKGHTWTCHLGAKPGASPPLLSQVPCLAPEPQGDVGESHGAWKTTRNHRLPELIPCIFFPGGSLRPVLGGS